MSMSNHVIRTIGFGVLGIAVYIGGSRLLGLDMSYAFIGIVIGAVVVAVVARRRDDR